MQLKRLTCMVLVCMLLVGTLIFPTSAAEISTSPVVNFSESIIAPLATNSFTSFQGSLSANSDWMSVLITDRSVYIV